MALLSFPRRLLLVLCHVVVLSWLFIWRIYLDIPNAAPSNGSRSMLLVTIHSGPKFWAIRHLLRRNKARFCDAMELICEQDSLEKEDGWKAMKFRSLLRAFKEHPAATGAIWVDGDTWLFNSGQKSFSKLLSMIDNVDVLIGRDCILEDYRYHPATGVCNRGVNTGIFWVRNSKQGLWWLQRMVEEMQRESSDQCAVNQMLADQRNVVSRDHFTVVPVNDSGVFQCRHRCGFKKIPTSLCCIDGYSWLVHWPAHEWFDMLIRILEQYFGRIITTVEDVIHVVEFAGCFMIPSRNETTVCKDRMCEGLRIWNVCVVVISLVAITAIAQRMRPVSQLLKGCQAKPKLAYSSCDAESPFGNARIFDKRQL